MAWTAEAGKGLSGVVSFDQVDRGRTRVTAQIEWQPEGVMEEVGAALGFDDRQVKADAKKFKLSATWQKVNPRHPNI